MELPKEEQSILVTLCDVWIKRSRTLQRKWSERKNRKGWKEAEKMFQGWQCQIMNGNISEDLRDKIIGSLEAEIRDVNSVSCPVEDKVRLAENFQLLIQELRKLS